MNLCRVYPFLLLQVLGTFESVASTVKTTLTEALVQILSPKRRVDILRDVIEAKNQSRPYVMAFCGVNGVGKSTNLAKVRLVTALLEVEPFKKKRKKQIGIYVVKIISTVFYLILQRC